MSSRERITLLTGRNSVARMEKLARLIEGWIDAEWREFNLSDRDAGELTPSDLLSAVSQVSMGDPEKHRVTVVRGVDRLRATEAEALRAAEIPGFVALRAQAMGVKIAPEAVRLLASRIGPDSAVLERELEKLSTAALENGVITVAMVTACTPSSAEHTVFELTDAVGVRDAGKALAAMSALIESGEPVFMLPPMIARQLRLVWQVKAQADKTDGAALKDPSASKLPDWQRGKLERQARAFAWPALESGMTALYELDLALKAIDEAGEDPRALVESLVLRLCSAPA